MIYQNMNTCVNFLKSFTNRKSKRKNYIEEYFINHQMQHGISIKTCSLKVTVTPNNSQK